jgi:hypothetical protein
MSLLVTTALPHYLPMPADADNLPTLKRQGLFPCEAEIARRLSQSERRWREIARQLEREGLPKIDPVMGGRFWPAVVSFFRSRHGLGNVVPSEPDGEEHWDAA